MGAKPTMNGPTRRSVLVVKLPPRHPHSLLPPLIPCVLVPVPSSSSLAGLALSSSNNLPQGAKLSSCPGRAAGYARNCHTQSASANLMCCSLTWSVSAWQRPYARGGKKEGGRGRVRDEARRRGTKERRRGKSNKRRQSGWAGEVANRKAIPLLATCGR